nr:substrate-binding domain-containing protein [Gordonia shandongensis]
MVIPLQGPGGIFGPSCIAVCQMVEQELNAVDGVAGRPVEIVYVDGGRRPAEVAAEVAALVDDGRLDAVTGWHISSVRRRLAPVLAGRIPYVYTSLFEGGEHAPGVYCSGETPEQQVFPAMSWLRRNLGIRRWHVVGARYMWPVLSMEKTIRSASTLDIEIVGSTFVEMGEGTDPRLPFDVAHSGCDAVLMLLVGQDAVAFNRSFAAAGLQTRITRYSPLMDENMLLASGADATENLYCSASYFSSLTSADALDFLGRYVAAAGVAAPALNNMAQSCYQGVHTLVELVRRARGAHSRDPDSLDPSAFDAAIDGLVLEGPRGTVRYHGNQAVQRVNIARADVFDFDVIETL